MRAFIAICMIAVGAPACLSGRDGARCIEGQSSACACTSGRAGAQVCTAAGTYGPCVCGATDEDAEDAVELADVAPDAAPGDAATTPDATETTVDADASTPDATPADADAVPDGELPTCPTAVITCDEGHAVAPQTVLHCHASGSTAADGDVIAYQWSVTQSPGSTETLRPSPTQRDIQLTANVIGTYTLALEVFDRLGTRSCAPAEYEVVVSSNLGIRVEVTWRTPGDANETDTGMDLSGGSVGSDVDLHVRHQNGTEYFDDPWDAYWLSPNPNWAAAGTSDDPAIVRDDTDGAGPEIFVLSVPEDDHVYTVGVHYWDDWGYGPTKASVRVYIEGAQTFAWDDVDLVSHDLWTVCEIGWPSRSVTRVGDGAPSIQANFPVPLGAGFPF